MGKIIAIGNIKGGVGKTTIAGQLALAFAHHGWPIGLIDADRQMGLASWLDHADGLECRFVPFLSEAEGAAWSERVRAASAAWPLTILDLPAAMPAAIERAAILADIMIIPVGPSPAELRATEMTLEIIAQAKATGTGPMATPVLLPNRLSTDELSEALLAWSDLVGFRVMPPVHARDYFIEASAHIDWQAEPSERRDILRVAEGLLSFLVDERATVRSMEPGSPVASFAPELEGISS